MCPQCRSQRYIIVSAKLLGDNSFEKMSECRKCGKRWTTEELLLSSTNQYKSLWLLGKSIPLHRWVWEQKHERALLPYEVVHHNNRNKGDNRSNNLVLMDKFGHNGNFNREGCMCNHCGHIWQPRSFQSQSEVRICPKCKSPYWDKERK